MKWLCRWRYFTWVRETTLDKLQKYTVNTNNNVEIWNAGLGRSTISAALYHHVYFTHVCPILFLHVAFICGTRFMLIYCCQLWQTTAVTVFQCFLCSLFFLFSLKIQIKNQIWLVIFMGVIFWEFFNFGELDFLSIF
jgi:hypothetical protein